VPIAAVALAPARPDHLGPIMFEWIV
jgi:hypothetical protein